jgi:nicotinamidase-related amidase
MKTITLSLSRESLTSDEQGYCNWQLQTETVEIPTDKAAFIICDMWDKHWAKGMTERVARMAPGMNRLASILRDKGVLIVHAASETMDFYAEHPARKRLLSAIAEEKADADRETVTLQDYPLPIDDSDGGSDTGEGQDQVDRKVWTREHEAIYIDPERDIIVGDEGHLLRSYLHQTDRDQLFIAGVATNMCILNRSFGIRPMLRRGFHYALFDEYTDTMYNPARSPYVSHDDGTALVCSYIRKWYCPTAKLPQGLL